MYGYGYSPFIKSIPSSSGGTPVDPDAQAFITAASITNPTQQSAINTLVTDLKGYGVWSKMKALYPFVGGTASQHKFNLKDPRDLDAAFRLVFNGGWTHSANGALPNGTNAFADTKLNPNSILTVNYAHLSLYSRTQNGNVLDQPMRVVGGSNDFHLSPNINGAGLSFYTAIGGSLAAQTTNTDSRSFYIASRIANNSLKGYKNSSIIATNTSSASNLYPNFNLYLGAANSSASPVNYSRLELAFSSIGDGLTDTEAANFYTAVQTFQVTLGRSIGTQTVSDADAQAFVTNAGIVDQVEADAVNNLVIGLKADGLWSKMKAIYPFVGGTASSHKFNLKNPLDTDAAFRLVFNGGGTHSTNGYQPNGVNAFADTKLNISLQPNWVSNNHLSFYSRTQALSGSGWNMGVGNASNGLPLFGVAAVRSGNLAIYDSGNFPSDRVTMVQTDGRGYWLGSTTALNLRKFIKNGGNVIVTNTNTTTAIASNANIFLGALNNTNGSDFFMSQEFAFSSIGDGLTDTEASNFYTRVQAFNTTLNRQV